MLENLTKNFSKILNNIIGKKRVSEENIKDILTKLRKSLIEADVSWDVIKIIISNIKNKLSSLEISKKISPGNLFLKVLNEEFTKILDQNDFKKDNLYKKNDLNKILFIGLQGSGKTTNIVKLAKYLKIKKKKKPLIISCDIYRPAAIEQMILLSKKASVDSYSTPNIEENLKNFLKEAINFAIIEKYDYLLVDSAGRLHTNEIMMDEILKIEEILKPQETFLVIDSMSGKNAIESINFFCNKIKISGFVLTKMDSDSKGGIILSLGYSTKIPIKFIGVGENIDDLEIFNPNGITSRILGMGDISGLIEKIEFDNKENIISDELSLKDLQIQMGQIINKGSIESIIEKLPGSHFIKTLKDENKKNFVKMFSIINSMTEKEKLFPNIINGSRKRRISRGSGTNIQEINKLLKNYYKIKNMNKKSFFMDKFNKGKI